MSGYIGNIPVPQATQTRDVFTASAGQTSFATSGYTPNFVDVYLNGVKLVNGTDFTATNGSDVVLTSGAAASDIVEVLSYSTFEVNSQTFTGSSTFTGDVLIADKIVHDGDTNTAIRFPAADTVTVETAGSERLHIDSSGNVGIDTNDPAALGGGAKLTVNQAADGNIVFARGGSTRQVQLGTTSTTGYINADNTSGGLAFHTNGSERARIDSSGNLMVGPTASGGYRLRIDGTNNDALIGIMTTGRSGGEYPSIGHNVVYTGSTGAYNYRVGDTAAMIRFNSGKVETFTAASGSVGTSISFTQGPYVAQGGTSWTNGSSDIRQKKNFEPTQGLSALMQVEPVKYHLDWEDDSATKRLGFKAQNLLTVIPEMVVEKAELADDGTPYLTITPDYILPVLVKATQEQQAIIEEQGAALQEALADIATLKAEVAALKGEPA